MKLSTLIEAITPSKVSGFHPAGKVRPTQEHGPGAPQEDLKHPRDPDIDSIHYRAQEVEPGGLFVAIPGQTADGHDFIDVALQQGAAVVVSQKPMQTRGIVIEVPDSRIALAALADCFYGRPSAQLCLIGITGTNGKTTTAYLIESILQQAGYQVGVIGTIDYHYGGRTFANPMTTPESLDLQRILAEMRQAGVTHVVMEVSSHAVDLARVARCRFDIGVFTNLSQDHLDYHQTMERYWSCKKRFFTHYLAATPKNGQSRAVINCEDEKGLELLQALPLPIIRVGRTADDDIRPQGVKFDETGIQGCIETSGEPFEFASGLVGGHNLENILCSAGVGVALKFGPETIRAGIEGVRAIPGRLERIANETGKFVYVDYAHTPDALAHALSALRSLTNGRLVCVFGCGGDRDKGKRPQMGAIAGELSDLAVITSDNPRTEPPLEIIRQVAEGTRRHSPLRYNAEQLQGGFEKKGHVAEADRRKAIRLGISAARPGDVVLIAGKGHETYQILGSTTIAFDDRETARRILGVDSSQPSLY